MVTSFINTLIFFGHQPFYLLRNLVLLLMGSTDTDNASKVARGKVLTTKDTISKAIRVRKHCIVSSGFVFHCVGKSAMEVMTVWRAIRKPAGSA